MHENYYEILIKNMKDIEINDNDKEKFFTSFATIKRETISPNILIFLLKNAEHPSFAKDALACMNLSSLNEERIIEFLKEMKYLSSNETQIIEFLKKMEYISSNDETLNWLVSLDSGNFRAILSSFKPFIFGNSESYNQKFFIKYNFPIIRVMDYCLKHANFEKFSICAERLEDWSLEAYWNVRLHIIEECIEKYKSHPEFFFLFSHRSSSIVKKYITERDISNLTIATCKMLISQNILPIELINCNQFLNIFKTFPLEEQIILTELLEGYDYPPELINQLHKLFNKIRIDEVDEKKIHIITNSILEVSTQRLIQIHEEIKLSSYFKKFNVEGDDFWLFINAILSDREKLKSLGSLDKYSYNRLRELYEKCYRYATESIVSSLYPLINLTQRITYMDSNKYNILCRVQTIQDLMDLNESFKKRTFCGFSILTQDNLSHYPGVILHGYYSNLTADLISHIYPIDSLSRSWAQYQKDLSSKPNMLLDIDDLNALTYAHRTYNQLCIRTKTRENRTLEQDAIICIEEVNGESIEYAEQHNKKILVLRKNKNTIENNEEMYTYLQ